MQNLTSKCLQSNLLFEVLYFWNVFFLLYNISKKNDYDSKMIRS